MSWSSECPNSTADTRSAHGVVYGRTPTDPRVGEVLPRSNSDVPRRPVTVLGIGVEGAATEPPVDESGLTGEEDLPWIDGSSLDCGFTGTDGAGLNGDAHGLLPGGGCAGTSFGNGLLDGAGGACPGLGSGFVSGGIRPPRPGRVMK